MSKTLVVFGATGQQGGSVIRHVLADAELSKQYTIRAVTRDPSSASSQALAKDKVEVVQADLNDPSSIRTAIKGAHTIFLMTTAAFGPEANKDEFGQSKAVADTAVAEGVQYLIFSTLPAVNKISGGKYTKVVWFDIKAKIEEYIRSLPIKSAFFSPASFMQNFHSNAAPNPVGGGAYMMFRAIPAHARIPLIDIAGDTGKFVGAILAAPDRYEGKVFCAAGAPPYSQDEMCAAMAKATGKHVTYQQVPEETFRSYIPDKQMADFLFEMQSYQAEFGYYGPGTEESVKWALDNARGKPSSFEEYLTAHPLTLE